MPPAIDAAVTPRPYQAEAIDAVLASLREHRSTLAVLATGLGKTIVFSLLTKLGVENDRRILILVDRDELVAQAVRRLQKDVGVVADVEKAEKKADQSSQVVVASIQTLSGEARLGRWPPEHFSLIVCDEAHHAVAPTWRRVLDYFTLAKIIGLTATPDRHDCKSLREVFEDVCFEMNMRDAVKEGWLVPIRQLLVKVEGLDFSKIRTVAGELHSGDLDAVVRNADILELMAGPTVDYMGERQTIVFCVSIAHAHAFVEFLRKRGRGAAAVDQKTGKKERRRIVNAYLDGRLQYLCNVGIFLEGFDAPRTSGIVMARPCKSRGLVAQKIGRGSRPLSDILDGMTTPNLRRQAIAASTKPELLVLDFVGNSGQHRLVHAAEALEPYAEEEVVEKAEQIMAENPQISVMEAMDMAEQLVEEARRRERNDSANHEAVEIDPFSLTAPGQTLSLFDMDRVDDPWERKATKAQVEALARFGVEDAHLLNQNEASAMLDRLVPRAQDNRATLRQMQALIKSGWGREVVLRMTFDEAREALDSRPVSEGQAKVLRRFGYTDEQLRDMKSEDASKAINAIKDNGWQRPAAGAEAP